jgi:hypothetical protein
VKKFAFAFIAMATSLALVSVVSSAQVVCPNATATNTNGYGGYTVTSVPGPNGTCGAGSAVQLSIPNDQSGYARLEWTQGTGGVPTPLTLGSLTGLDANVSLTAQAPLDQPFYMILVQDPTDYKALGLTNPDDQLLFIQFQPSTPTLVGTDMAASANTALFNMYDNSQGFYLNGTPGDQFSGQPVTNTLAGWLSADPYLSSVQIEGLRIGIGMDGGCSGPCAETLTIHSLDINPPVPAPESSSMPMFFLSGFVLAGVIVLKARSKASA